MFNANGPGEVLPRKPIAGSAFCCARPTRGQPPASAPRPGTNSRRRMHYSTAGSGHDAGPLKVAVEMSFALLVTLLEQPTIAAFRVGQDFPAIIVAIPEEEAVGAVLQMRSGDFFEAPLLGLCGDDAVRLIHLFRGADIEPVVVEEVHPSDVLAVDDGNRVGAA